MQATTLIEAQLSGVHQLFHAYADDLTETEWMTCALPGTNLLGFTLWHMVRGRDWAVQTAILGVPEVIVLLSSQITTLKRLSKRTLSSTGPGSTGKICTPIRRAVRT